MAKMAQVINETAQQEFLTEPQERDLIAKYRAGLSAEMCKNEISQNSAIIAQGKEAEERLLVSHFPLVRAIALDLYLKNNKSVELEELISAGNEGLVVAIRKFDPAATNRFSTYAMWWIRNRMSTAIRSERWSIRIPDAIYKKLIKVMRFIKHFRQLNDRDPTAFEIAKELATPVSQIWKVLTWANHQELSLEMPVGDDGKSTLGDLIEDRFGLSYQSLEETELKDKVRQVLRTLTPREEKVLKLRFGIDVDESQRLNDVGESFALSAERVRQIEVRGTRKLRHISRRGALQPFLHHA